MILGISYDTAEENKAFAEAQGFPYRLLCDTDRSVSQAYGAVKSPDDDWPDFARRITYLIDPQGRVSRTYTVTDVAAHPGEVLADLHAVAAGSG